MNTCPQCYAKLNYVESKGRMIARCCGVLYEKEIATK